MAGMEFEYDEEGSTFYYFLLSFWALVIIPATYYLWPRTKDEDESYKTKRECHCPPCNEKRQSLKANTSWVKNRRKAIQLGLILGWAVFFLLVYKVSMIQMDYVEYDPFQILQIDREASDREIKKAYRKLSLQYHPDMKSGDSKMFMRVAKAYAALTDEETKKNWIEYGNPDGPGVMRFGIALPKWIVDDKNSMWVLMVYIVLFMVIMPAVVGVWWYRSIKFSKDQVLLDTTRLYMYFFSKNLQMIMKKLIMVMGASFEFDKFHNSEIIERPSDNEEVPMLMKQLPNLDEKNKERPLCFGYSVKARALLHAHFARLDLPKTSLDMDRKYILKKTPALVNEMINVLSQLVASAMARQRPKEMPRLDTVENCMKLSQMIIQGLDAKASPLQQLPHIRLDMLRHFVTKKRNVQRIRDLVALEDDERRALLRMSDEEYQDVINVCAMMPNVEMTVRSEVLDDEDSTITAGSIVTVTVKLKRKYLMEDFDISKLTGESDAQRQEEEDEEEEEEKEGAKDEQDESKQAENSVENKPKAWQKHSKGKKKSGKPKIKKTKQAYQWKKAVSTVGAKTEHEASEQGAVEIARNSESENESENESDGEEEEVQEKEKKPAKRTRQESENDEDDWEKYQEESKKENSLDTKKKESHIVHCPYFPDEKQEAWWLYVADKKNHMLVTAPVQIQSLKKEEEVQLKFSAPPKPGIYTYSVQLRSDSYFDFDQSISIKLDVKDAKVIEDHPQWDISDDEEDKDNALQEASDDSDYSTDAEDSDY